MLIKKIIRNIKQRHCRHNFVEQDTEYNRISKLYGGDKITYKCSHCGKIVFMKL